MKILVLSDSHSGLSFMRYAVEKIRPDAVVHLGDYYDDGEVLSEEFPHIRFHQVGGNCDRFRSSGVKPEKLCYDVCSVRLYMVHGHNEHVKQGLYSLLLNAGKEKAQAALFGHTHIAYCTFEDGLWVVNPGSCGSFGGSVALLDVQDGKINACHILRQAELEEFQ